MSTYYSPITSNGVYYRANEFINRLMKAGLVMKIKIHYGICSVGVVATLIDGRRIEKIIR